MTSEKLLTKCPICGAKRLKVSIFKSQIWHDRVINGTNGTLTKGKLNQYRLDTPFISVNCSKCNFELSEKEIKIINNKVYVTEQKWQVKKSY